MKIRPGAALVHLMQSVVLAFIATSFSSGRCFAQDQVENNTLAALIKSNQFDAASEALKSGANVNAQLPDGMTALHWALQRQQNELVGQLLQSGADPNLTNHYGVPPLWITCCAGDVENTAALLGSSGDPNAKLHGGETLLMTASRTGSPKIVELLLESGAEVNAVERNGQTALMWAAAQGNTRTVEMLIAHGADPEIKLRSGFNAFFFAARQGKIETVLRLIKMGSDVDSEMKPSRKTSKSPAAGTTALILAIENGHFKLASELLSQGANPNIVSAGYAPLHAITWVRKPIRGDGDPKPIGSGGTTSLDLVQRLIDHGADVNIRHKKQSSRRSGLNRTDATPLLLAAETGDLPLLKLLIKHGGDIHLANHDQASPLLAACGIGILSNGDESAGTEQDAIDTVSYLFEHGAELNGANKAGETVMHGAAYKSWPLLISKLDHLGASPSIWNQKNQKGWTPLMIAQGHRPGNFRPSEETVVAIEKILQRKSETKAP